MTKYTKDEQYEATQVIAWNSCRDINPDNPAAVAESIKPMYEALKELVDIVDNYLVGIAPRDVIDTFSTQPAKQALAKVEEK